MRRNVIALIFGCILAGLAGGCSKEQPDKFPTPTAIPTKTAETTPGSTAGPTVTLMPVGIEIPIKEEYFGDIRFCAYLKENFDADGNGFFSNEELAAITEIKLSSSNYMMNPYTELKGFSYFAELDRLELNSADSIILRDVPKLTQILFLSQYMVKVGEVIIENCPELRSIYMSEVAFRSAEGVDGNMFLVKNCPNFRSVTAYDSDFACAVVDFTDASPELEVSFNDVVLQETLKFNSSTYFSIEPEMVCKVKEKTVSVPKEIEILWCDGDSQFPAEKGIAELEKAIQEVTESFYVRLEEVEPSDYDEYGRKAYYVTIDSTDVGPESYESYPNQDIREEYKTQINSVIVYLNEQTKEEQFYIKWDENMELPVTYSAARGMSGGCHLRGELYHVTEEEDVCIGYVIFHCVYEINEEGQLKFDYAVLPRIE